jgi:hypothetical protein
LKLSDARDLTMTGIWKLSTGLSHTLHRGITQLALYLLVRLRAGMFPVVCKRTGNDSPAFVS